MKLMIGLFDFYQKIQHEDIAVPPSKNCIIATFYRTTTQFKKTIHLNYSRKIRNIT